nr:MAG TPA: hypothetical protein [Caudoviricetes sp.]
MIDRAYMRFDFLEAPLRHFLLHFYCQGVHPFSF